MFCLSDPKNSISGFGFVSPFDSFLWPNQKWFVIVEFPDLESNQHPVFLEPSLIFSVYWFWDLLKRSELFFWQTSLKKHPVFDDSNTVHQPQKAVSILKAPIFRHTAVITEPTVYTAVYLSDCTHSGLIASVYCTHPSSCAARGLRDSLERFLAYSSSIFILKHKDKDLRAAWLKGGQTALVRW